MHSLGGVQFARVDVGLGWRPAIDCVDGISTACRSRVVKKVVLGPQQSTSHAVTQMGMVWSYKSYWHPRNTMVHGWLHLAILPQKCFFVFQSAFGPMSRWTKSSGSICQPQAELILRTELRLISRKLLLVDRNTLQEWLVCRSFSSCLTGLIALRQTER